MSEDRIVYYEFTEDDLMNALEWVGGPPYVGYFTPTERDYLGELVARHLSTVDIDDILRDGKDNIKCARQKGSEA